MEGDEGLRDELPRRDIVRDDALVTPLDVNDVAPRRRFASADFDAADIAEEDKVRHLLPHLHRSRGR